MTINPSYVLHPKSVSVRKKEEEKTTHPTSSSPANCGSLTSKPLLTSPSEHMNKHYVCSASLLAGDTLSHTIQKPTC